MNIKEAEKLSNLLSVCVDLFENNDRFSIDDKVIVMAISKFNGNNIIDNVLPKVILINSFYSTQIYDTNKIAKHILSKNIDSKLQSGDLSVIDDIRSGHGISGIRTGKELNFYSFATKYASLHEPTKFPIFDTLVMRLLSLLNKKLCFYAFFKQNDLRDYKYYVSVLEALMEFLNLSNLKFKRLDQGLWIYAKYLYDQSNLTKNDIEIIRNSS